MKKIEIIKTIKAYEQELNANWEELADAFGYSDEATQKAFTEWMVIEELLTRLNLTPNEK